MNERMLSKVLVTTDLSPASQEVFEYALKMRQPWQGEIVILHVFDKDGPSEDRLLEMTVGEERLRSIRRNQKEQARQKLIGKKKIAAEIETGSAERLRDLKISVKVLYETNIAACICETAQTDGFELIVMGLHRRTGLENLLGKSTVGRVIEKATVPVIVFPITDE